MEVPNTVRKVLITGGRFLIIFKMIHLKNAFYHLAIKG